MNKILEVVDATKQFGGLVANEGITFDVNEGEIVGIVGPNGAGKTTLFNSISGVHTLTRGKVVFRGEAISNCKAFQICKKGIGRTFQIPQSLNDLTVFENVLVGALCHNSDMEIAKTIADSVLEQCEITALREMRASKLNVGQKKRLEIARALATGPKLLLLDETMAGLTPTERKDSVELIRKLNGSGITILTIEHNMDVVMSVSSRVVVLASGKVLFKGTPSEVCSNESVIDAYLRGTTCSK
jgi:branched-chain amino acid transport system ATP-binding protein